MSIVVVIVTGMENKKKKTRNPVLLFCESIHLLAGYKRMAAKDEVTCERRLESGKIYKWESPVYYDLSVRRGYRTMLPDPRYHI